MSRTLLWLTTATLAGIILLIGAGPASAADQETQSTAPAADTGLGIRLLDVPVDQADDPRAREYITQSASPGTVIRRKIRITNATSATKDIRVYATGATIGDGTFDVSSNDRNELSDWTSLDRTSAAIHNGSSVDVNVSIEIPADAAGGEYYAVIWAEMRASQSKTVQVVNRVGIRAYIDVSGAGRATTDFTIDHLHSSLDSSDFPLITARVRNIGQLAVDLEGRLSLSEGPGKMSAGPFTGARIVSLAPGQSGTLKFRTSTKLPIGTWNATVEARSGTVTRESSAKLALNKVHATVIEPTASPAWPTVIAVVLGGMVIATVLLIRKFRKRYQSRGGKP
ncbi:hypothetical protein [Curtobacterium sp. ZW137]|uniref:hypothetical protein n=1 Tax=Curtobacterium sp. ZW137 TaxID=2485104 RepID=UPI000F4CBA93|nr:hypothetical protein [Curtobacterium sp. ZW137]ROP65639.1 hypothetical protein EDF55_0076 [Curtobacterium sp. ZW137]